VSDVRSVLAATDLVVSASSTEGQPGAIIEAALCGVPAVATDVGGTASVVGDGGVLVGHDPTPASLAEAIVDALAETETLGRRALERATDRFAMSKVAEAWRSLLDEVVDEQRSTSGPAPDDPTGKSGA
jgi:glycosyltransferase involved in cell wall biosynthesis